MNEDAQDKIKRAAHRELSRAILNFGTARKFAEAIGSSPSAVSTWLSTRLIPPIKAIEVEKATKGRVTREKLRPDLPW